MSISNAPNRVPVTVIIPVRNEVNNIRECLLNVSWADQIYVVDSYSEDGTAEVARSTCERVEVVQFEYRGGWPKKKNWAIRNLPIRNPWFLILDADERVSEALAREIGEVVQYSSNDGYYLRWDFRFLGRRMSHCWRHGWMLRLVRYGKGEYEDLGMRSEGGWDNEVHENIVVSGATSKLKSPLIHESSDNLSSWIAKQNQYSDWNAVRRMRQAGDDIPGLSDLFSNDPLIRRRFLKGVYLRLPFKPLLMFFYLFVAKGGLLDGREGFYFCALRAAHELNIAVKMYELRLRRKGLLHASGKQVGSSTNEDM